MPICNLCGALRDNKVKNRYCGIRSVNIRWDKVIDCAFLTICENKKIKCQNSEKNSKMVNKVESNIKLKIRVAILMSMKMIPNSIIKEYY